MEDRIEGAGASIVSHAAELETQGMDAVGKPDEEPELPVALQDLIQRLQGKAGPGAQPLKYLPDLTDPKYGDFFTRYASPSTNMEWRNQVRLRVLEAIGRCNTLRALDLHDPFFSRCLITAGECEIVLRGVQSSTVLEGVYLDNLESRSAAEVEKLCLLLGRILETSITLESLCITRWRLTARGLSHLASGLQANSQSNLKYLILEDAWEDASVVKHVAPMVNSTPRLERLNLARVGMIDEDDVQTLSQALIQSSSLKAFLLHGAKGGASALLLKAFAGDSRNQSIQQLQLGFVSGLDDCLPAILSSNRSLREVWLQGSDMRPEQWRVIGQAIRDNATAATIHVRVGWKTCTREWHEGVEELVCAASSDVKDPIIHFDTRNEIKAPEEEYTYMDGDDVTLPYNLLKQAWSGKVKSLRSLNIEFPLSRNQLLHLKRFVRALGNGEPSTLKILYLRGLDGNLLPGVWKQLFWCMRGNTSLTHLELWSCEGLDEEAFKDLMGLLQVNLTLQSIRIEDSSWVKDGKEALIQEVLRHNKKRAAYASVFRDAKLKFGDAKAGRLFLCGSPKAGKTQLRQTLMRIIQGKSWLGNKLDELWRTKGIEMEFMRNDDKMQVAIWDLAGQWIFRTLQNVLFPQTNNFCVFLFVYSPFHEETSVMKPDSCFKSELEDWLRFIASSIQVTGHNLPQVLVVLSHKDKMTPSSLTWAHSIVEELKKDFANLVDLCPSQKCFHVDARRKKQVIPLKNHIFKIFENLLSEKSPRVPHLCFQISSLLVTNTKENRSCPLWSSTKFHEFCAPILKEIIPSFSLQSVDHSSILKSIITYLNAVGSIIYIPNIDYIIVDPTWLTNEFLGELIALGQDFQAQKPKSSDKTMSLDLYSSKDGFVSESVFVRLLEGFLGKKPRFQNVDREVLENILINLDLCFKLGSGEDTSRYFIPSIIREHASMQEQEHQDGANMESMSWNSKHENSQLVGIRIQCKDERRMSLTAAFFPRFQIFMRHKLISEMHVPKETVTCSRHYLRVFLDGHEIYLEHIQPEKSRNHVDVLMLCSKHKSRELAVKYVMKHIVEELTSFCASPKGCPGVALVLGVIQTQCVQMLIPSHLRGVILIEKLKSNFLSSLKEQLEEIALDRSHLVKEEMLLNYEHSWPPIPGYSLSAFERAKDLLWESDVEAVVNEIQQQRSQQLESLQEGLSSVNDELAQSDSESEKGVGNLSLAQIKNWRPASTSRLSRASTTVENRSTRLVVSQLDELGEKVDGLDDRLRAVESIMQRVENKMGQILSLQHELQSTLRAFMSNVDRSIGYSESLQQARTPKRPYITVDDVGSLSRITAALRFGSAVRLHLMCESVTGIHVVKDQEGLELRLDQENRVWLRNIYEISCKFVFYVVKAGLHVTLGLGQALTELGDLETVLPLSAASVALDSISSDDRVAFTKGEESMTLNEAWLRMTQALAPQLENKYSKIFKLYQVKYGHLEGGGYAWVCEQCMTRGLRTRILTSC
ncbi:hypothetical protein Mapa_008331 [Marchantia paleacea]|nr:hypothetical protein Mapa_008331 [Marchantia paleacea]